MIRGEGLIKEESGEIEANIHTTGDKEAVEGVTLGGSDPFAEICNRWENTEAFSNAGLEIWKLADFFFESRTRYRVVGNVSIDFALDTVVDKRIRDDVEEDGANGCGRCV